MVAEGHFRRKREAPLTVEGCRRTLSGPSPDPSVSTALHFPRLRRRGPGGHSQTRMRAVAAGDGVHGEPLPGAVHAAGWSKTRGGEPIDAGSGAARPRVRWALIAGSQGAF